jgi:periplasmic divalent cation tolerance protein
VTSPPSLALVLTTFPADQDAAAFARTLVAEHLVACVNILPPMQSIYHWQGRVEEAAEHQLIIKTSVAAVDRLKKRLTELHPYEVPEIVVLAATAADTYRQWVDASVSRVPD